MKKFREMLIAFIYTCYIRYLSFIDNLLDKIDVFLQKIEKD